MARRGTKESPATKVSGAAVSVDSRSTATWVFRAARESGAPRVRAAAAAVPRWAAPCAGGALHGGAGGGSGGTGGCGGKGGKGGQPGGSSIGIAVVAEGLALNDVWITTGNGGKGGNGGALQPGGTGGLPGLGGAGFGGNGGVQHGCAGGAGGHGGNGGNGGGGHGGHSAGIVTAGDVGVSAIPHAHIFVGSAGLGGKGGNPTLSDGDAEPGQFATQILVGQ